MKQMRILWLAGVMTVAVAILLLAVACGTGSAVGGREDNAFQWGAIFTPSKRTVVVGEGVDYCVGDPRPRIAKPEIQYRGDDVYIRLELKTPRFQSPKGSRCAGVGLLVKRKITLRRDLSDVELYDSGVEPPELRWPR